MDDQGGIVSMEKKKNVQYKIINPTKKSAMPHEIGKSPFRWIFPAKSTKLHV